MIDYSPSDSRALTREILATLQEVFLILDAERRIVDASSAFFLEFGLVRDEILGRCIHDIDDGMWNSESWRGLLDEATRELDFIEAAGLSLTSDSGTRRRLRVNVRPVAGDPPGETWLLVSMRAEVAPRRKWHSGFGDAAPTSAELDEQWAAGVGQAILTLRHEINNPLTILLAQTSLLEMGGNTPEEIREMLASIGEQTRRIRDIVRSLAERQDDPSSLADPNSSILDLFQ